MANAMFDLGRQAYLQADIDFLVDNIAMVFVDHADDTPVLATDDFLDDILAAARVATSGNLSGKTSTNGVADATDETVSAVSGDQFESIVFFRNSGTESTSHLFLYVDTATGLPYTPSGGDVLVQFANTANKIFKL